MYPYGPSGLNLTAEQSELRLLWAEAKPDRDKILAKQKEILDLQKQLEERATAFQLEARKVLTPEQQARLGTFGHGRGRMGRW